MARFDRPVSVLGVAYIVSATADTVPTVNRVGATFLNSPSGTCDRQSPAKNGDGVKRADDTRS
jgi:hypothetical protein